MQFLLTAYDGDDSEAFERRMKARPAHLERMSSLRKNGGFHFGGAILDDKGNMIGSMVVYEFPDRQALEEYLKTEPYVTGNVWQKIDIHPFRLANVD